MQSVIKGAGAGLRERKKRATRAALSEAAVRLAAEHGAENVTVEAISNAAGVSPRTFFNYFDSHDDAFIMIDGEIGERIRQRVRDAPAALEPLAAVREALAKELADVEQRHEVWSLRAKVLQKSPHLMARGLGVHLAEERDLAQAIAWRLNSLPLAGARAGVDRPSGTLDAADAADAGAATDSTGATLDLYPRLLAAVANTAVRVSVEHWYTQAPGASFADVFRDVFTHLAAGLRRPATPTDD